MRRALLAIVLTAVLVGCGSPSAPSGTASGTPAPTGSAAATGTSAPTGSAVPTRSPAPTGSPVPTRSPTPTGTSTASGASEAGSAPPVAVTIRDFRYRLPEQVAPGARLQIRNLDDDAHTFTIRAADVQVAVRVGETGQGRAPRRPGTYEVVCEFHADMEASLVVR